MPDKDLLVGISEMLRKQDQQAEILAKHTQILEDTNESLKSFVDISIQQFQEQHKFNEQVMEYNKHFMAQFDKQNEFNERMLNKLDEIAKKPWSHLILNLPIVIPEIQRIVISREVLK